jgi:hypothetical protein
MGLPEWVRLPSAWIAQKGLCELQWGQGRGSDNIAALMALTAIAHNADQDTGVARITYERLCSAAVLCRTKLSDALDVLERFKVIERSPQGRSTYKLSNYSRDAGWAKLPARSMYSAGSISAFNNFSFRNATELNALKLFFLFLERRDRATNLANISFDKIEIYTGMSRSKIKAATSMLAALEMVYVERIPSAVNENGVANAYRVVGLDSYAHMGTMGRRMGAPEFDFSNV